MAKRRCKGTTKKNKRCRATPRRDTGYCNAHSPKEVQEKAGFGGPQEGSGRPRNPRPHELARQLVEGHLIRVLRPYFAALGLELLDDGSVVDGRRPIKFVWAGVEEPAIEMEDLGAQIMAAEKLLDRIYGKPRQQLEHTGGAGAPPIELDVAGLSDVHELLRRLASHSQD